MSVTINLPAEIEKTLRCRASATGKDIETIVQEFVTERLAEECSLPARAESHDEFMAKLRGIIELHPISNGSVDDSRESIYGGRGE